MESFLNLARNLSDEEALILLHSWEFWARPEQLLPHGDWHTWLLMAGRGFGKTRTGAETIRRLVENHGYHRIALIAADIKDVRDVMVEGESGILSVSPPWNKPKWNSSISKLQWPNGAVAYGYSAEDPESLRGPQFDCAWGDEFGKGRYADRAYDQLQFGMRLGRRPLQIFTTTPRPTPILKKLLNMKGVYVTKGSTSANLGHLSPSFAETVISRYAGTRLGRQELDAEMLDDNPDALWSSKLLEQYRVKPEEVPAMNRTVIGVDPPATQSGRCGIVAAGQASNGHGYVLGDHSVMGRAPMDWARAVVSAYHLHSADAIVVEVNQGGDMVAQIIRQVDSSLPIHQVRAYKGKWLRAEPVASLYEQGRVRHVGMMAELEDQMIQLTPENLASGKSPDNLDACVYALWDLMLAKRATARVRSV